MDHTSAFLLWLFVPFFMMMIRECLQIISHLAVMSIFCSQEFCWLKRLNGTNSVSVNFSIQQSHMKAFLSYFYPEFSFSKAFFYRLFCDDQNDKRKAFIRCQSLRVSSQIYSSLFNLFSSIHSSAHASDSSPFSLPSTSQTRRQTKLHIPWTSESNQNVIQR